MTETKPAPTAEEVETLRWRLEYAGAEVESVARVWRDELSALRDSLPDTPKHLDTRWMGRMALNALLEKVDAASELREAWGAAKAARAAG